VARRGDSETLSAEARERLRHDILAGRWAPGDKLQLIALSEDYGTSSTVVREALTRLTAVGLVELIPNRGFFVPRLSLAELRDFNELRCRSEEFGIALAIERGDLSWESGIFGAHHTLERTPPLGVDGTLNADWVAAHAEFHLHLISACGLPVLIELSRSLTDRASLYLRWSRAVTRSLADATKRDHRELLDAVADRDGERAGTLLRAHYTRLTEHILGEGLMPEAAAG